MNDKQQPDSVCRCGKTSEGVCRRCGQNLEKPKVRLVSNKEIEVNPNLSLRAEDYL